MAFKNPWRKWLVIAAGGAVMLATSIFMVASVAKIVRLALSEQKQEQPKDEPAPAKDSGKEKPAPSAEKPEEKSATASGKPAVEPATEASLLRKEIETLKAELARTKQEKQTTTPAPPVTFPPTQTAPSLAPALSASDAFDKATREFFGTGVPTNRPSFENKEEETKMLVKENWLVAKMCNLRFPPTERKAAALELGKHPTAGAMSALSFVLKPKQGKEPFAEVRAAAAISLGEIGDAAYFPLLEETAKTDPSPAVKTAAQTAAQKIKARAMAGPGINF